jgi:quercetin dioxygenase-like cupin family protein
MTIPPSHLGERFENEAPRTSARVPLPDDGLQDDRGEIINLLHGGIGGTVSVIKSKAGARRASHLHAADDHYLWVRKGRLRYYERAPGETHIPVPEVFVAGDLFYTPPQREHILIFDEDTEMISMSSRSRTHEEHESDVRRVVFEGLT